MHRSQAEHPIVDDVTWWHVVQTAERKVVRSRLVAAKRSLATVKNVAVAQRFHLRLLLSGVHVGEMTAEEVERTRRSQRKAVSACVIWGPSSSCYQYRVKLDANGAHSREF